MKQSTLELLSPAGSWEALKRLCVAALTPYI